MFTPSLASFVKHFDVLSLVGFKPIVPGHFLQTQHKQKESKTKNNVKYVRIVEKHRGRKKKVQVSSWQGRSKDRELRKSVGYLIQNGAAVLEESKWGNKKVYGQI